MSELRLGTKFQSRSAFAVAGLATALLATGCGSPSGEGSSGKPVIISKISECDKDYGVQVRSSNVSPTYIKNSKDYTAATDPVVLLEYQQKHASAFKEIGIGTLVCNKVLAKSWTNTTTNTEQVLSQMGVEIANKIS